MARNESSVELEQTLSLLSQNFFRELSKIAEQRLKLERQSVSAFRSDLATIDSSWLDDNRAKNFTVRFESSLGEKLAKSKGTADELEDRLQETRLSFEDKLQTVERMRTELDRREDLLVHSIRQIEAYLRAVFYLKREADSMFAQLKSDSEDILKEPRSDGRALRKESILKAVCAFQPAKEFLEKMVTDKQLCPGVLTCTHLVEYFLVLELLRDDLLRQEAECSRAQEMLSIDRQRLEEYRRRLPTILISKENDIFKLKSELNNLKDDIAHVEGKIELCLSARLRDERAWFDVQRWIKKLSIEIQPQQDSSLSFSDTVEGLKDFTKDALQMVERLTIKRSR